MNYWNSYPQEEGPRKEISPRHQAAYEIGFGQVFNPPARRQKTVRRSVHLTENSITITEETTYTEEYEGR